MRPLRPFSVILVRTISAATIAAWLASSATADAKPKKKDTSGQKGKKSKSGKGSMDESAGQSDGDLAPGSDDA
ncbi:MAG TPA: hypothetical protein VF103_01955, partial [Polyangiaceae bacterium]